MVCAAFNQADLHRWNDGIDRIDDTYGEAVHHLPNSLLLTSREMQEGDDRRVPIYIAADFTDALPQRYETTLYIEVAFSADGGETIAQSVVETVEIAATIRDNGTAIDWLVNRVHMRPELGGCDGAVAKLADSNQEQLDWSDSGWTYDQALAVMSYSLAGRFEEARMVLEALRCLQNDDGSWFFRLRHGHHR